MHHAYQVLLCDPIVGQRSFSSVSFLNEERADRFTCVRTLFLLLLLLLLLINRVTARRALIYVLQKLKKQMSVLRTNSANHCTFFAFFVSVQGRTISGSPDFNDFPFNFRIQGKFWLIFISSASHCDRPFFSAYYVHHRCEFTPVPLYFLPIPGDLTWRYFFLSI